MHSEFRTVTDRRLGDPTFAPTGIGAPALRNGFDILVAAPDQLGRRWAKLVSLKMYDAADTLLDCHDIAVAAALEYLNREAAWGNVYSYSSYRTAREELAAVIAAEMDTAIPERRRELTRAQSDPRSWAEQRRPGRGMAFPTGAQGLRVAQLFHMDQSDVNAPGVHTHVLVAPEVVASNTNRHPRAQPGKFYELELITMSSVLPAVFGVYLGVLDDFTDERLSLRLARDPRPSPTMNDERLGIDHGKVNCHPLIGMRQLDEVSGARWQVPRNLH